MTLLPEAVGAGMWKPEYEFPGMHSTTRPSQAQLPCKDTRKHKDTETQERMQLHIDICTQLHMQKQSHVSAKLKPRAGKAATQCVTLDVHSNKRTAERHRDTKSDSLVVKYPLNPLILILNVATLPIEELYSIPACNVKSDRAYNMLCYYVLVRMCMLYNAVFS